MGELTVGYSEDGCLKASFLDAGKSLEACIPLGKFEGFSRSRPDALSQLGVLLEKNDIDICSLNVPRKGDDCSRELFPTEWRYVCVKASEYFISHR